LARFVEDIWIANKSSRKDYGLFYGRRKDLHRFSQGMGMAKRDKKESKKIHEAKGSVKGLDLRTVDLPQRPRPLTPAGIRALRASLNASQALLARVLNVSSNTVESWEQGIREPRQATLKLLHIARKNPAALLH
jgi:DNA-binding transcriptional regulator YiaG